MLKLNDILYTEEKFIELFDIVVFEYLKDISESCVPTPFGDAGEFLIIRPTKLTEEDYGEEPSWIRSKIKKLISEMLKDNVDYLFIKLAMV